MVKNKSMIELLNELSKINRSPKFIKEVDVLMVLLKKGSSANPVPFKDVPEWLSQISKSLDSIQNQSDFRDNVTWQKIETMQRNNIKSNDGIIENKKRKNTILRRGGAKRHGRQN